MATYLLFATLLVLMAPFLLRALLGLAMLALAVWLLLVSACGSPPPYVPPEAGVLRAPPRPRQPAPMGLVISDAGAVDSRESGDLDLNADALAGTPDSRLLLPDAGAAPDLLPPDAGALPDAGAILPTCVFAGAQSVSACIGSGAVTCWKTASGVSPLPCRHLLSGMMTGWELYVSDCAACADAATRTGVSP